MSKNNQKGFTLIEILIVIGIIAILATIVIIAINPARQFAQARDIQRVSNLNTILNAVGQNMADNKGFFTCAGIETSIPVTPTPVVNIGTDGVGSTKVNLACLVPTYISTEIPMDPVNGTSDDTKYSIQVDSVGRFTICTTNIESSIPRTTAICVTR